MIAILYSNPAAALSKYHSVPPTIARVSQRVPLSTSTGYEACAISNPSSCYAKVQSFFQAFLTNYLLLSKIRLINFSHCTASSRCITRHKANQEESRLVHKPHNPHANRH